jgi:hypothetical protein
VPVFFFHGRNILSDLKTPSANFPTNSGGIGNNSPENTKESYTFTQFYINPQISRKVKKNFFVGFGIDYQDVFDIQYDSLGNFEKQQVVGI